MEVIDTRVLQGRDAHMVEFQGEGGEQVRVTLVPSANPRSDQQLIESAKAMLVQVATFGIYERSIPETEPDTLSGLHAADADTYTLEYEEDGEVRQMPDVRLPHIGAVEEEVRRSAEDLWRDALSNNRSPTGWAVRARDAKGTIVASIDYAELKQLRVDDAIGG